MNTSTELSVHHPDSLSVNSSPFAANPSKLPGKYGENSMVKYLHENPVKSPTVSALYVRPVRTSCVTSDIASVHASSIRPVRTSCVTSDVASVCASSIQSIHTSCVSSDIAPVCASSVPTVCSPYVTSVFAPVRVSPVPSVLTYDDEHQEFSDGLPGTNYGEKNPSEIMVKFSHDVTLTLQQAKFPEETPDITKRVKYPGNFFLTRIKVKLMVIHLRNYVLGVFHIASCTMRCAHGSINKILME